jgi:beta-lactamase class A
MKKTSLTEFETSPGDIGLLFQKVYKGEVISDSHQSEFLKFLTKTAYENWLPAGLPEDIKISHKIGKDQGTFSDGGIIFGTQPYILVVISKDAREDEANKILPAISSSVWAWERSATL